MADSWPADRVERWPLARLVPNARNARAHSDEQVTQLAASIEEWGWTIPVLVDEAGGIIAGHGRVMAAHRLGLEDVPVMVAAGWSDAKKRAYMLADNKLTLNAEWDLDRLAIEIAELRASDFDVSLIGFSESEIDDLLKADGGGLTDPDEAPDPPAADPVSAPGDVWLLGKHRLVCGDCTDPLAVDMALNGVKPHLLVSDPPYGVGFERGKFVGREKAAKGLKFAPIANDDLRGAALAEFIGSALDAWAVAAGTAYLWSPSLEEGYSIKHGIEAAGFKVQSQLVWRKTPFVIGRADYHWQHEICWYAFKGPNHPWHGGRDKGTVWDIPKAQKMDGGHPTQKPVECMKRPIENNSSPGQAVYDPFVGSGTTIIAAEMTGRVCHAIEIHPAYVDVSVLRWQNFTGKQATMEATGKTFAEVAIGSMGKAAGSATSGTKTARASRAKVGASLAS
jgi:DNA modification methylase